MSLLTFHLLTNENLPSLVTCTKCKISYAFISHSLFFPSDGMGKWKMKEKMFFIGRLNFFNFMTSASCLTIPNAYHCIFLILHCTLHIIQSQSKHLLTIILWWKIFSKGEADLENCLSKFFLQQNSEKPSKKRLSYLTMKFTLIICKTHFFVIIHDAWSRLDHPFIPRRPISIQKKNYTSASEWKIVDWTKYFPTNPCIIFTVYLFVQLNFFKHL